MVSSRGVIGYSIVLAGCFCAAPVWAQQVVVALPSSKPTLEQLRAGFVAPPAAARLRCYWWWLNGNTDKPTITHDLEEMKAKGFGGVLLVDADGSGQEGFKEIAPGPLFGSPAWVELYTHALREADRLGLEITLNITSGWNIGGPDVTPEQAAKHLTFTRTRVAGGKHTLPLAMPETYSGFYKPIAVLAYPVHHAMATPKGGGFTLAMRSAGAEAGFSMPDTSAMLLADDGVPADTSLAEVRNVSAMLRPDGTLMWDGPAGEWEILRIGYTDSGTDVSTSSGEWQGPAIDYLSAAAMDAYWSHTIEPLVKVAKPFHSLKYLAEDSWEIYTQGANWTQGFAEEFKKRRGYDPVPWLPVVAGRVVGDSEQSTRFLTDLRRTVADLVTENHYVLLAKHAAEFGLGVQAESGGPHGLPIDALETFRAAAIPQTEFWSINGHRPTDKDRFFTKEAASAAHIYGQHLIAQESETSMGPQWSESLAEDLKPTFDMAITEGMNRMVWHEFTSIPAAAGMPGNEYFAGTHINPKVTWWNAGGAFFTYLNRAQFLMQQGLPVNDLLYFYGDNIPNFVRVKADDPAHVLPGFDYDVTDEDALLRTIAVKGGVLVGPGGMRWRALALPVTGRVSMAVLERVEAYVREGGVVIGLRPTSPTGMTAVDLQARFDALTAKVWGAGCDGGAGHAYGKGMVFCTRDSHAALMAMHVALDVDAGEGVLQAGSAAALDYLHQRVGDADLYFMRNATGKASRHEVAFRVSGKKAELWDAVTGEMLAVPDAKVLPDGREQVSVELPAYGSVVVAFVKDHATREVVAGGADATAMTVVKPWEVSFQKGRGGPAGVVRMPELTDWSAASDPAVKYFAGTAVYRGTVVAPSVGAGKRVWMRFADVREIARVRVNGVDAGTVWAKPLEVRVDSLLKPGENTVEIEVTNLWPNRIIGDLQPGVVTKITSTNINLYKADSPLLPSGLIGPVEWVVER